METSSRIIDYKKVKENYAKIIDDFARIPRRKEQKVKVGIVGEIFVKFSPLGNNNLEDFLISEGAETVMPGLLDFCLYCVYNGIVDEQLYGTGKLKALGSKVLFKGLIKKQHDIIDAINLEGSFEPPASFSKTCTLTEGYMGLGAKWARDGFSQQKCLSLSSKEQQTLFVLQPFGCLPNHIVGKGVMKLIKEKSRCKHSSN